MSHEEYLIQSISDNELIENQRRDRRKGVKL